LKGKRKSVPTIEEEKAKIKGIEDAYVYSKEGQIKLNDILYIPSLKQNLMSARTLIDKDNVIVFMKNKCLIVNNLTHTIVISSKVRESNNSLYRMENNITNNNANVVTINDEIKH